MFIDLKNIIDTVWVKPRVERVDIPLVSEFIDTIPKIRMYNIIIKFKNKYVYRNYKDIANDMLYITNIDNMTTLNPHLYSDYILYSVAFSKFSFYEDYNNNNLDLYINQNKEHYMLYISDNKLYSKLKMLIE